MSRHWRADEQAAGDHWGGCHDTELDASAKEPRHHWLRATRHKMMGMQMRRSRFMQGWAGALVGLFSLTSMGCGDSDAPRQSRLLDGPDVRPQRCGHDAMNLLLVALSSSGRHECRRA